MSKSKTLAFDEASSGSDDDGDEEEATDAVADGGKMMMMPASDDEDESDSDDDDDDDDDGSDDGDSDHSDGSEPSDDDEKQKNGNARKDNDDDDNEEDLPLDERIEKKEQQGLAMQEIRKRKSRALKTAGERLATLKRKASNDNNNSNNNKEMTKKAKKSKHAPTEVSSKRADYYKRGVPKLNESGVGVEIGAHRYKPLDPRISNLHGHLDEEQFEQNYSFLEGIRNKEIKDLKKRVAARKVTGKKGNKMRKRIDMVGGSLEEDQEKIKSLQQQKAEFERRKMTRTAKQTVKRKIRDDVAEGKRGVYFLKRKEQRQLEMEAKLDLLRKKGGDKAVDKAIERRRKKNKSRDASRFVK
jgi:ribosomal RNA-processing protein 36